MNESFKISVVGAGTMGKQISLCAAIHGFTVTVTDSSEKALEATRQFATDYLKGRVTKGRLTQEQADAAVARYHVEPDFNTAVGDADLVIEAVVELLDVKRDVFRKLDQACPEKTILATNSSYIVSSELACVTRRADKVCNMHFFVPALVMKLVEIVKNPLTSKETENTVYSVCEQMQKVPVVLNREIEGFLVDNVLTQIVLEAHRLADMGIASPADIDKALKFGLGHPMGPFELNDTTGLDLRFLVQSEKFRKSGDPKDRPGILLTQLVHDGDYGKKTGRGFYDYTSGSPVERKFDLDLGRK